MVDKTDTIRIEIELDISEKSKEKLSEVTSDLERADQGKVKKRGFESKEFVGPGIEKEELERKIKEINEKIRKKKGKDVESLKQERDVKQNTLDMKLLNESPVGVVRDFTSSQAKNLKDFTSSPGAFFIKGLTKVLGKYGRAAVKGGIFAIIALLVYETVLFVLDLLMQPGRLLDRRFKRIARLETMNFYERTLQEEIRHGYQEIRVTTMQGLRGGASQVNGNFFEFSSGATGIIQSSPYRSSQSIYQSQIAKGLATAKNGSPRRRSVFFGDR